MVQDIRNKVAAEQDSADIIEAQKVIRGLFDTLVTMTSSEQLGLLEQ